MNDDAVIGADLPAWRNVYWTVRRIPYRAKSWLVGRLVAAVVWLVGDTNTIRHAKIELRESLAQPKKSPDRWMADDLLQLLAVFAAQGHSGSSAPWAVGAFEKLARFEPLGPLTGGDDEWLDHGGGVFQNIRCGHVFKQSDRFNGQAYDLDGRIFREPNGCCYTNRDSMVPITFPYTPKREYVDVPGPTD